MMGRWSRETYVNRWAVGRDSLAELHNWCCSGFHRSFSTGLHPFNGHRTWTYAMEPAMEPANRQAPTPTGASGSSYLDHRSVLPNQLSWTKQCRAIQLPSTGSNISLTGYVGDFYTASSEPGPAHFAPTSPGTYIPSPGPPPPSTSSSNPGDRQPTLVPNPGHPLLKNGVQTMSLSSFQLAASQQPFLVAGTIPIFSVEHFVIQSFQLTVEHPAYHAPPLTASISVVFHPCNSLTTLPYRHKSRLIPANDDGPTASLFTAYTALPGIPISRSRHCRGGDPHISGLSC